MKRLLAASVVVSLALGLGCTKKEAPSGSTTQADKEACAAKTCGACLHEGGCWWNAKTKVCQLGLPQSVDPEKDTSWSNDPGSCK